MYLIPRFFLDYKAFRGCGSYRTVQIDLVAPTNSKSGSHAPGKPSDREKKSGDQVHGGVPAPAQIGATLWHPEIDWDRNPAGLGDVGRLIAV